MCGIIGNVNSVQGLRLDLLKHRGPDGDGVWNDGNLCQLGHTRLAIIDLDERAAQPMVSRSGRFVISYNGEVYNYKELQQRFLPDFEFRTSSDTEVVLELWERMGTEAIKHLRGMFGFAVWDRKERDMFLVRDRLGKKPLVYSHVGNTLSFASELNALEGVLPETPEIDPRAVDLFLAYQFIPAPLTIYRNCSKLPPAHFACFKDGRMKIERYWEIEFDPDYSMSEESAEEQLEEMIRESVRLRLRSDVEVGILLSGGVDSSVVACIAAQECENRMRTFSIGFDYGKSELKYAEKVAEACGSNHLPRVFNEDLALSYWDRVVSAYGEPYGDSSAFPSFFVSETAASRVKVVLNGDGGDELMGGYGKYSPSFSRRMLSPVASAGHALGCVVDDFSNRRFGCAGWAKFADRVASSLSPYMKVIRFNHFFSNQYLRQLYRGDVFAEVLGARSSYEKDLLRGMNLSGPLMCHLQRIDYSHYFSGDLLVKMDIAGMSNSLEVRSPLIDHKLFEFAAKLPPEFKIKNGETKYLLKKIAAKYMPREVIYRPKAGFSVPVSSWAGTVVGDSLRQAVNRQSHPMWNYINRSFVRSLLEDTAKTGKNGHRLWLLSILGSWLDMKKS